MNNNKWEKKLRSGKKDKKKDTGSYLGSLKHTAYKTEQIFSYFFRKH